MSILYGQWRDSPSLLLRRERSRPVTRCPAVYCDGGQSASTASCHLLTTPVARPPKYPSTSRIFPGRSTVKLLRKQNTRGEVIRRRSHPLCARVRGRRVNGYVEASRTDFSGEG